MSPSPRHARSLLLASAIAAVLSATLPSTALAQQATQDIRPFDIAAQPLRDALAAFTHQSGRQVVVPPDLQGRSTALRGALDSNAALAQLLQGSGWRAVPGANGSYRLVATQLEGVATGSVTAPLSVEGMAGASESFQGKTAYSRRELQSIPATHGHITSVLRLNPAVQLDDGATSSNRPGDLEPASISIHGAPFWQNLFTVDGMSVNNDINPGNTDFGIVNSSSTDLVGNTSQGIALDIGLVERVDVYDSNVPAEYGGFNGGVVDAITRMPSQALSGSVSYTHTRDAWASYQIDEWKRDQFENTGPFASGEVRDQPEFKTDTWRLNLEGHLTETFGLIGSFTRKRSDIYNQRVLNASMANAGATLPVFTNVFRQIDNYFVKGVWTPTDRFMLETVVTHEPHQSQYFNINAKDGDFIMDSGGTNVGMTATFEGDRIVQTHKLNWSSLENSRTGGPGRWSGWRHSADFDWGQPSPTSPQIYGTWGNLHQEQESLGYQGKLEWAPVNLFGGEHRFALGAGLSRTDAAYVRRVDHMESPVPSLRPTRTCTDANGVVDTVFCSTAPLTFPSGVPGAVAGDGQYASYLFFYQAGSVDVRQDAWSVWAEDDMRFGRARFRPGLRIDGDSYMDKISIAPRLAFEYDFAQDGSSRLVAGANRYYGRNVFDYALRVGRETLEKRVSRGPDLVWQAPVPAALNTTVLNDLDIPYDDELTLGFRQIAWGTAFELKYVNRRGRDQIVAVAVEGPTADPTVNPDYHYTYQNIGRTDTDSVSLTVQPQQVLSLGGTRTRAQFIGNWTDVERSHNSYESRFEDHLIRYDGELMTYNERPVGNYSRPWTARFFTQTEVPALNLTIGSFLSWRGAFDAAVYVDSEIVDDQYVDVYERRDFGTAMTWDLRFAWQNTIGVKAETLFANLDVTNVLNRRNVSSHVDDFAGAFQEYELGRHFQLEVGYRF